MSNDSTLDGTTTFKRDIDGMANSATAIKNDVANLAHGAVDAARSGAGELRDGAKRAVDTAKAKLGDAADMARDEYEVVKHKAADAAKSLTETVAAHPIASIGIAAGVGIVVGLLLSRPRA